MLKCIFCGSFFDPFFFDDGAHLQGRSLSCAWYTMTRELVAYSKSYLKKRRHNTVAQWFPIEGVKPVQKAGPA